MSAKRNKRIVTIRTCKCCGKQFATKTGRKCCSKECASMIKPPNTKETLCWDCKKSTGGSNCPWANELKPVEGWEVIPTKIKMDVGRKSDSYKVINCPLFKRG